MVETEGLTGLYEVDQGREVADIPGPSLNMDQTVADIAGPSLNMDQTTVFDHNERSDNFYFKNEMKMKKKKNISEEKNIGSKTYDNFSEQIQNFH